MTYWDSRDRFSVKYVVIVLTFIELLTVNFIVALCHLGRILRAAP